MANLLLLGKGDGMSEGCVSTQQAEPIPRLSCSHSLRIRVLCFKVVLLISGHEGFPRDSQ